MIPKGNKDHLYPQNFRPISILIHLSKLFEHLLHSCLILMVNNNVQLPSHYSLDSEPASTLQLNYFEWLKIQPSCYWHFLDVQKAFHRVCSKGPFYKLHQMQIPNYYIQSFLQDRSFRISYNRTLTNSRPITAGVSQGSVLSHLLYNLYKADLPIYHDTTTVNFADNIAIFWSHRNINYATIWAQCHLQLIEDWAANWRTKINPDKHWHFGSFHEVTNFLLI